MQADRSDIFVCYHVYSDKVQQEQCHNISPGKSLPDTTPSTPVVVMEFRVFQDTERSQIPKGYLERPPGGMIFTEPRKVDWFAMQDHLCDHGYKYNSFDVYYIMPGSIPPQGMVLLSCEEDVREMMQALIGIKKCDLYLLRNYPSSDDDNDDGWGGQDEYEPRVVECSYRRDRDSDDEMEFDQYGSSPSTKQPRLDSPK